MRKANFKDSKNVLLVSDSHRRQHCEKQYIFILNSVISPGAKFEYIYSLIKLHFNSLIIDTVIIVAGTNDVVL